MKKLRKLICVLLASAMMLSMAAAAVNRLPKQKPNTTTPTETEAETEDTTSAETTGDCR